MKYFILMLLAVFSLNAKEGKESLFFPGENLKDFNYFSSGLSPIVPAYDLTKDVAWLLIPEVAIGQRHFISKRNAIDYGAALQLNFNLQLAHAHADYLFFPMPEYGFYAGAGMSMNECFYFCFHKNNFHYWPGYHALVGIQFKLEDGTPAFVKFKYSPDGTLTLMYGASF